jgi:hypothetical protein
MIHERPVAVAWFGRSSMMMELAPSGTPAVAVQARAPPPSVESVARRR